jgi:hypothetical protein
MKPVAAALLAAALLPAAVPARAQELGRLFFTPEQRAALDARRKARLPDKPVAAAPSPTTRLDGHVQRSGGRSTVWVNGEPLPEGAQAEDLRLAPRRGDPARLSVRSGEEGKTVEMKVGSTLDRGTGEARDVIGEGEIKVRR